MAGGAGPGAGGGCGAHRGGRRQRRRQLAAAVCLLAREAGGNPAIAFQMLLYPATDFAMDTPSHRRFGEGHLLTRASMAWFRDHYLNHPGEAADWRASPLRAASLAGLRRPMC